LIVRLRLLAERLGWKRILLAALGVVALAAVGAVAVVRGGGGDNAGKSTRSTASEANTNLFYLRALPPKVRVSGCVMNIRFTWRPDYHADQYMGAPAPTGTDIEGTYRRHFKAKGVRLEVGPIYRLGAATGSGRQASPRWTATHRGTTRRSRPLPPRTRSVTEPL